MQSGTYALDFILSISGEFDLGLDSFDDQDGSTEKACPLNISSEGLKSSSDTPFHSLNSLIFLFYISMDNITRSNFLA